AATHGGPAGLGGDGRALEIEVPDQALQAGGLPRMPHDRLHGPRGHLRDVAADAGIQEHGRRDGRARAAARAGVQGRHEAAAHQRRHESRRRPDDDRGSAQGRAAGARRRRLNPIADALLLVAIAATVVYLAMMLVARRRERELARSRAHEERLRSLTELSADWFWETDAGHRITWLSGGGPVATLFRDTPTYAKQFWEIPGVEVDPRALEAHLERLERQLPFFDLEIARTDERGARQVHIISGQSHHGTDGAFRGYRGVGRDINEQRRAEASLSQAKARLEMALDGGNLAEWHYDIDGDELSAADGWVRSLGHQRSPPITRGAQLERLLHADDLPKARSALMRALKGADQEFDVEL